MNKTKKDVEDKIFNLSIIPADKRNDGIKQIATSIGIDKNTFFEFVKILGVGIFDFFYRITTSGDDDLSLELTAEKKQEFQMRLNVSNQIQLRIV